MKIKDIISQEVDKVFLDSGLNREIEQENIDEKKEVKLFDIVYKKGIENE